MSSRRSSSRAPFGVPESSSDSRIATGSDVITISPSVDWSKLLSTFPTRLLTRNKYTEIVDISSVVGGCGNYQFRLNSTFDPNLTGAGHQPSGRDILVLIYNRYRVHRADWAIEFSPATGISQEFCVGPQNHSNTYATITDAGEQPRSVLKSGNLTSNLVRFRGGVMLHTVNGQTQAQYAANEDCAAIVSASPTEVINLSLTGQNFIAAANFTACSAKVTIWYTTEWYDPVSVPQS